MDTHQTLDPPAARKLLEESGEWCFLDVRTVEEYEAGHAPGAYNVPAFLRTAEGRMAPNPRFVEVVCKHFEPERALVVGCAAGGRSERACQVLAARGFARLVNMIGGFSGMRAQDGTVVEPGWAARGFPVETGDTAERCYADLLMAEGES